MVFVKRDRRHVAIPVASRADSKVEKVRLVVRAPANQTGNSVLASGN